MEIPLFGTVSYQVQPYADFSIFYILLIALIVLLVTELSVATGASDSGCPISVKIVCRYSPLQKFMNWDPILASTDDMSSFFIILNFIWNFPFVYGINLIFFFQSFS